MKTYYLYHGNSFTGKTISFYWDDTPGLFNKRYFHTYCYIFWYNIIMPHKALCYISFTFMIPIFILRHITIHLLKHQHRPVILLIHNFG